MQRTVLSVLSTLAATGPVKVMKGIIQHHDPTKYRAKIVTLSPEERRSEIDEIRACGIDVEQLNLSRVESLLWGTVKLKAAIRNSTADLIHCHGARADILVGKLGLSCPTVSTIHADLPTDYSLAYGKTLGRVLAKRQYQALKKFSAAVAVSDTASRSAADFGVTTQLICNGIDLTVYRPFASAEEGKKARSRLGFPDHKVIVLHTGALIRRKQPLQVITSFQQSALSAKAILVFAGVGPLREECEQHASNQNVIFLGHRNDIPDLLRCSDLLISASISEGLPMALLEACASGISILASDIYPHRQIRDLFPEKVALFKAEHPDSLTAALDASARKVDLRGESISEARLGQISAKRMARLYEEVYDRL